MSSLSLQIPYQIIDLVDPAPLRQRSTYCDIPRPRLKRAIIIISWQCSIYKESTDFRSAAGIREGNGGVLLQLSSNQDL